MLQLFLSYEANWIIYVMWCAPLRKLNEQYLLCKLHRAVFICFVEEGIRRPHSFTDFYITTSEKWRGVCYFLNLQSWRNDHIFEEVFSAGMRGKYGVCCILLRQDSKRVLSRENIQRVLCYLGNSHDTLQDVYSKGQHGEYTYQRKGKENVCVWLVVFSGLNMAEYADRRIYNVTSGFAMACFRMFTASWYHGARDAQSTLAKKSLPFLKYRSEKCKHHKSIF